MKLMAKSGTLGPIGMSVANGTGSAIEPPLLSLSSSSRSRDSVTPSYVANVGSGRTVLSGPTWVVGTGRTEGLKPHPLVVE